jgi:predicted amidohydrolase YtcJ
VLWFPNPMNSVIAQQVQDHYMERIWPLRDLHDAGTLVAAGSDWPVGMPVPNPWLSIETMVTRRSPDPAFPGSLAANQALDLDTAWSAPASLEGETSGKDVSRGIWEEVPAGAAGTSGADGV